MQTPQNINNYGFINFDIQIFYPYQQHEMQKMISLCYRMCCKQIKYAGVYVHFFIYICRYIANCTNSNI